jgi:hypothetical protein
MALCPRRLLALDSHGRRPWNGRSSLGSMGTFLGSVKDSEAETGESEPPSPPLGASGRERLARVRCQGVRRLDPLSCTVSRERDIQGGHPASARHGLTVSLPLSLPLLFLFSGSLSDLVSLPLLLSRNRLCISLHISHRSYQVGLFPTGRKLSIGAFSSSKRLLTPAIATQVPPPRVLLSTLGPRTPPLHFCRSQSLGPQ